MTSAEDKSERQRFLDAVKDAKRLEAVEIPDGLKPRKPHPRRLRPAPSIGGADSQGPADGPVHADTPASADEHLSFRRAGVQDRVLKRLRRGLIPVEAELDLHGMTQSAAWDALRTFIELSRAHRLRCVRIVHGKGYRSGARGPVLKSAVNSWLRPNLDVIAFVSARTIDGGTGALYVLLRA